MQGGSLGLMELVCDERELAFKTGLEDHDIL